MCQGAAKKKGKNEKKGKKEKEKKVRWQLALVLILIVVLLLAVPYWYSFKNTKSPKRLKSKAIQRYRPTDVYATSNPATE